MNKTSVILGGTVAVLVAFLGFVGYMLIKKQASPTGDKATQNQDQGQGRADDQGQTQAEESQGDAMAGWLTYTDSQKVFSFKYPASFGANVWQPTQWPPAAVLVGAGQDPVAVGCGDIHDNSGKAPQGAAGKTSAGLDYKMYAGSDIGAGQLYSSYCYVFGRSSGGAAVINFVIKSHSACGFDGCGAYCGTQYEAECTDLDRKAAIEDPIAKMAATFVFNEASAAVTDIKTNAVANAAPTEGQDFNGKTVTLAENQTNVALEIGSVFLLKLGEGYNWNATVVDNAVIDRETKIAVVRGAQGTYRALKAGDTDLTAMGDPVCRSNTPPCGAPSIFFTVHVAVR